MDRLPIRNLWDIVIVLGGPAPIRGWSRLVSSNASIIAADSGADHAHDEGLVVTHAVGDFDSISAPGFARLANDDAKIDRHPTDKDETDFELALDGAERLMPTGTALLVVGGAGGRLDHEFANLTLLAGHRTRWARLTAVFGEAVVQVARPECPVTVIGRPGELVSLLPVSERSRGTTTHGLRFALANEALRSEQGRGVSNVIDRTGATVSIERGALLVIEPHGVTDLFAHYPTRTT